jgi:hypothetical protein
MDYEIVKESVMQVRQRYSVLRKFVSAMRIRKHLPLDVTIFSIESDLTR